MSTNPLPKKTNIGLSSLNRRILSTILECLEDTDLQSLVDSLSNGDSCSNGGCDELLRMAVLRQIFKANFNRVDRSYYLEVYENPEFSKIEMEQIY